MQINTIFTFKTNYSFSLKEIIFAEMNMVNKGIMSLLLFLIKVYQLAISPFLGVNKCRYVPTCSEYAKQALIKHGIFKGFWLALKRIGRCAPWGGHGFDPVP